MNLRKLEVEEHYIYKIINNKNNMYYLGKRSCKGLAENDNYMGSSKHLKASINKHGVENYTKIILAYSDISKGAYELEDRLIKQSDVDNPMCYNQKYGGKGGMKGITLSQSHKNKIGLANTGRVRTQHELNKLSRAHIGKKLKPETKAKISKNSKMKGKTYSKHQNVKQIDKYTDEVIKVWDCARRVEHELLILSTSINNCLKGITKSAGGYRWEYN